MTKVKGIQNKSLECTCKRGNYKIADKKEKDKFNKKYNESVTLPLWICQKCYKYKTSN